VREDVGREERESETCGQWREKELTRGWFFGALSDGEKFFGFTLDVAKEGVESSTRGFVGDTVFAVLPNIKPSHCFAITVALQAVSLFPELSFVLSSSQRAVLSSVVASPR